MCAFQSRQDSLGLTQQLEGIEHLLIFCCHILGPAGIQDIGKTILQKSQYAIKKLSGIKNVKVPRFDAAHFKEFVVDFSDTDLSVSAINKALLQKGIFGGKNVSLEFPDLGESALYCVTEIHTKEDIDSLCDALEGIVTKKSGKDN